MGNTAQLLHRGSLRAHYLLYQPPQWLQLSTGSTLMHPFPNFSRSSCLKRSWKKKYPFSLSPTTHLHSSCSSPWSPCSERTLQQDWTYRLELFCEKPGCSSTLWKTNFFFSVLPAWLPPFFFFPQARNPAKCAFLCYDKQFLTQPVKEWTPNSGFGGLFCRKSPHTYISW